MATATAPGSATESPTFQPFVPPERTPAEMTFRAVFLGAILGVVFAASSVYLAHVAGLQVALGGFAQNDLVALAMFAGVGFILFRVASR